MTWAIIGLCAVVACLQLLQDPPYADVTFRRFGVTPALLTFDLWPWNRDSPHVLLTLVTSLFVHAGVLHVAGNMLFFHCFSQPVETLMGSWRYAIFYLACGIGGSFAHGLANPDSLVPLVGASGAVAGVLAAHALLLPWTRIRLGWSLAGPTSLPAWGFLATWTGLQFVLALDPQGDVAWGAHLGGVVAGLLLAPLLARPGILVMAPTPESDDAVEHGPGMRVTTLPAMAFALLLVVGFVTWLASMRGQATPETTANARYAIALHRLVGEAVPRQPDSALALYREIAPTDPRIALDLANLLHEGKLVPPNQVEAVAWYGRAAEAGLPEARYHYALAQLDGDGVPRDATQALATLRDLARGGYRPAVLELAHRLEQGTTVPPDPAGAANAFRRVCDGPATAPRDRSAAMEACTRLALMLFAGRGVPADPRTARSLLERAAAQDYPPAQNALGLLLSADDPEASEFDARERPEDSRARGLFIRAAIARDPDAMYNVARIEEKRPGPFPMSDADKRQWYERSAAAGNRKAIERLKSP